MKKLWLACILMSSTINAQTFDFSCVDPFGSYIADFIEDSGRIDLQQSDFNGRLLTLAEIRVARPNFPSTVIAFATPCTSSINWVYVKEAWDRYPDIRKRTIYHEIGHSLYNYRHPMRSAICRYTYEDGRVEDSACEVVAQGFNNHVDIMGYDLSIAEPLTDASPEWDEAKVRFFAGTEHIVRDCTVRKGIIIIDD